MNTTTKVLVGIALVLGVLGLILPRYSGVLGGITRDDIRTTQTLTVDGASTLTGNVSAAGTLAVTGATTLTGNIAQAVSSTRFILRSLDNGQCIFLHFASTTGAIATTTITCP